MGSRNVYKGPAYATNWQRLGRLPFRVFIKGENSRKEKPILSFASKRKICQKKNQ